MNAKHFAHSGSAYLPDPWCTSEASHPPELEIFHRFVGHQVREYSNSDQRLSAIDNVKFLLFMARNGLSSNTISAVLKQYFSEYKSKGKTRWQRVALLDRFLFDVFRYYFKHLNPDFSTFFCNSTAHLQHSYWRHMEPDKYTVKPSREELDQYSNAIKFGYQRMDLLLGEIMSLAGENTQIIFSTALSQQPYLKYEHIGGHNFYRPRNINDLLGRIGVNPVNVQPVMTHQFLAKFENDDIAQKSKEVLSALMIGDMQIFGFDDGMPGSIYFGSQIRTVMASDVLIKSSIDSTFSEKFSELFYKIDGLKSGRHHPEGCLWIQTGEHAKSLDKVSILDILPTIAKQLDVVIAGYPGRSLI
jgi:hypothetical protein